MNEYLWVNLTMFLGMIKGKRREHRLVLDAAHDEKTEELREKRGRDKWGIIDDKANCGVEEGWVEG